MPVFLCTRLDVRCWMYGVRQVLSLRLPLFLHSLRRKFVMYEVRCKMLDVRCTTGSLSLRLPLFLFSLRQKNYRNKSLSNASSNTIRMEEFPEVLHLINLIFPSVISMPVISPSLKQQQPVLK